MSINNIKHWFEVAVPNPTVDNQRVQLGVHLEECSEMFDSISETSFDSDHRTMISATNQSLRILSNEMKKNSNFALTVKDHVELLDALCDQIVTATGVAHMYGYDILGALAEVSRSNDSKFESGRPVFNANGKIMKGMHYNKPNLEPFVPAVVNNNPEAA